MATQSFLIDQITMRSIFVLRAAGRSARDAQQFLPGLLNRIRRILRDEPSDRLFVIAREIEQIVLSEFTDMTESLMSDLVEFGDIETEWASRLLVEGTLLETVRIVPEQLLATFTNQPMVMVRGTRLETLTPNQLLRNLAQRKATQVGQIIRDAQVLGETARDISPRIGEVIGPVSRRDIETDTLTLFNHYSNQAKDAAYQANADILDGVRIVATLDSRTSPQCRHYDGMEYPLGVGPRPPFHRRCRTQAVPQVAERFRIPVPGRTRASQFGPVDAQLTYDGFLRRQSEAFQNEVLGPNRAAAFRRGLPVDRFTDNSGITLTLDQLRNMFPDKFPQQ